MPVTLTPVLRTKIERRAKRAFRHFDEGVTGREHRISGLTKDSLQYRLPRTARSTVKVIRKDDGEIVVDPPTTGLVELLTNKDIERLQNHAGEVQGFIRVLPKKKMLVVGELIASQYFIESRAAVETKLQSDQRVFRVQANASAVEKDKIETDKVLVNSLEVLAELDLVKDFKFTDGVLDLLVKQDTARIKKHVGEFRAYMYVRAGTTFQVGSSHLNMSGPLTTREQAIDACTVFADRVYTVESAYKDLTFGTTDADPFTSSDYKITAELDPVRDLGFSTGLFDCLTKADVEKLRKKRHLGRVRAYKYTTKDAESPVQTHEKIKYEVGKTYEIKDADTVDSSACHKGINVADAEWCKSRGTNGNRVFAFEFDMKDIAAIPTSTDGKFRLHRCVCVAEVDPKTFQPLPGSPGPATPSFDAVEPKKKGFLDKLLGRGDEP